ncbi:hypothetical protein [Tabrizicola fusiformis]|uniref:hypothetical protein n=1 Tax=Tabrizicola sp. SY72 TaxID=2741673 RepID=UPI00157365AD|nr:hypothetical protein [Tabrizicola sp. SY72]NTT85725.1 hypothetical protein [Tabrizicola sp. SY72]
MAEASYSGISSADQGPSLSDFYTQVDDTYHALRALNFLIDAMHESSAGGVSALIGYGIGQLLRRQIDDLEDIKGGVSRLIDRVRAAEEITADGARHGLPSDMMVLPAFHPGMEHEARAKVEDAAAARIREIMQNVNEAERLDRQEPTATELREAMIVAQLRDGVEPGIIAQALNLRKSAVAKVAAKLTVEAQDATPSAKAG